MKEAPTYEVKFKNGGVGRYTYNDPIWEEFFLAQWKQYGHKISVFKKGTK